MQVSVDSERRVIQHGDSLGKRGGCTVEDVSEEHAVQLRDALSRRPSGGHVVLSADHSAVRVTEPAVEWVAAEAARDVAQEQRVADLAVVKAHAEANPDNALWQAFARLVGAT